jgi:CspA family cold shock protein
MSFSDDLLSQQFNIPSAPRCAGTVRFFDEERGFGFIKRDGAGDIFVHARDLQQSGVTSLDRDQRVDFEIREGKRGPIAGNIRILK